jgi:hypothetical protein
MLKLYKNPQIGYSSRGSGLIVGCAVIALGVPIIGTLLILTQLLNHQILMD